MTSWPARALLILTSVLLAVALRPMGLFGRAGEAALPNAMAGGLFALVVVAAERLVACAPRPARPGRWPGCWSAAWSPRYSAGSSPTPRCFRSRRPAPSQRWRSSISAARSVRARPAPSPRLPPPPPASAPRRPPAPGRRWSSTLRRSSTAVCASSPRPACSTVRSWCPASSCARCNTSRLHRPVAPRPGTPRARVARTAQGDARAATGLLGRRDPRDHRGRRQARRSRPARPRTIAHDRLQPQQGRHPARRPGPERQRPGPGVAPALLPGDALRLAIVKEGKEPGQGLGYLDDGTMVVVEQGREAVGSEVEVVVTNALQTSAGRMIFAKIEPR